MADRGLVFTSLDDALRELDCLAKAAVPKPGTVWTWPQTLIHRAQSIEFSLTGFPREKSPIFQRTIGAVAFSVFSWRRRMTHDLSEPIPDAPSSGTNIDAALAVARRIGWQARTVARNAQAVRKRGRVRSSSQARATQVSMT